MARQITIEEVKKHKRKNSVWMIIHDDVYDVTRFLNEVSSLNPVINLIYLIHSSDL